MDIQNISGAEAYIFIGKAILVFLSGGIVFHMIVMTIDYYLMIEPSGTDRSGTSEYTNR